MIPKYMEVYSAIRSKIENHTYAINDRLPTGEILAKTFDCSVLTVKKALDKLVNEGYVVRKRGLGSFVKRNEGSKNDVAGLRHFHTARREMKRNMTSRVLCFEIEKCREDIAKELHIEVGEFIYYIERVRLFDNEPRIIEYTWMPIQLIPGLQMKHVQDSIYYYISKELNLHIQSAHVVVHAVRPNELEKTHFQINDSDFLAEVVQTAYLDNSEIFEYSISRSRPEYFEFETTILHELY